MLIEYKVDKITIFVVTSYWLVTK